MLGHRRQGTRWPCGVLLGLRGRFLRWGRLGPTWAAADPRHDKAQSAEALKRRRFGLLFCGRSRYFLPNTARWVSMCCIGHTTGNFRVGPRVGWNKNNPNRLGALGALPESAGPLHDRFSDAQFLLGAKAHGSAEDCFETL
jgi:hypothetical protein